MSRTALKIFAKSTRKCLCRGLFVDRTNSCIKRVKPTFSFAFMLPLDMHTICGKCGLA